MILVPIQIKPSDIDGLGLFSLVRIPKGTLVWEYREPTDCQLSPRQRARELATTGVETGALWLVDGNLR